MEPGRMLVRARCEKDINNLFTRYGKSCRSMTPPSSDELRDYRWRLSISRQDWIKLAGKLAEEVDYSNFKMAFQERADQAHKSTAYAEIWWRMRRVQEDDGKNDARQSPAKRKVRKTMSVHGKPALYSRGLLESLSLATLGRT
jgi:hypothetical protein